MRGAQLSTSTIPLYIVLILTWFVFTVHMLRFWSSIFDNIKASLLKKGKITRNSFFFPQLDKKERGQIFVFLYQFKQFAEYCVQNRMPMNTTTKGRIYSVHIFKFGIYAFKNAYLATFLQIWMN
jgi:hypothetical protein